MPLQKKKKKLMLKITFLSYNYLKQSLALIV
jgi:hypothetical protein